ncbi:hypothetical protein [Natrinema longum]|uniref:hypothetical protein n=1 Tax=Natrinema longum TaxID=370324 RepID=UPI001CCF21B1|nr:hypothetical protein [Natrinema longum]MBZ6496792.1 hypothetical protein [Natrinema longum]
MRLYEQVQLLSLAYIVEPVVTDADSRRFGVGTQQELEAEQRRRSVALEVAPADHHSIYSDESLLEIASEESAEFYHEQLVEPFA